MERWTSRRRALSKISDELFDIDLVELDPYLNDKIFGDKVLNPSLLVSTTWNYCPLTHAETEDIWIRPDFRKPRPYGGNNYKRDSDAEREHSVGFQKS